MTKSDHQELFSEARVWIDNGFQRRLRSTISKAREERSWHILESHAGGGKSTAIFDLVTRVNPEQARLNVDSTHEISTATGLNDPELRVNRSTTCPPVKAQPILAARACLNAHSERVIALVLANALGIQRAGSLHGHELLARILNLIGRIGVEQILIDNADSISLAEISYLMELADRLALPPYNRRVSLCLIRTTRCDATKAPNSDIRKSQLWQEFQRRLDALAPVIRILDLSMEEVGEVLLGYEDVYRDQFPGVSLYEHMNLVYRQLTAPALDPTSSGRVPMYLLRTFVVASLRHAKEQNRPVDEALLMEVAADMTCRSTEGRTVA